MRDYLMERNEFADFIGVDRKTYYGWETGISQPKLETALAISKKLNRHVDEIWILE